MLEDQWYFQKIRCIEDNQPEQMETTDHGKLLQEDDYISMSEQNCGVSSFTSDTSVKYAIQMSVSPSVRIGFRAFSGKRMEGMALNFTW